MTIIECHWIEESYGGFYCMCELNGGMSLKDLFGVIDIVMGGI